MAVNRENPSPHPAPLLPVGTSDDVALGSFGFILLLSLSLPFLACGVMCRHRGYSEAG